MGLSLLSVHTFSIKFIENSVSFMNLDLCPIWLKLARRFKNSLGGEGGKQLEHRRKVRLKTH